MPYVCFLTRLKQNIVSALLRVDWRWRKRRGCRTEGAKRRNRLQGGSGRGDPRYQHTHTNYLFGCICCLLWLYLISCVCPRGSGVPHSFFYLRKKNNGDSCVVVWIAVTCLDPGMSNCTTQVILVNINGDEMENINPTQQLGEQADSFILLEVNFLLLQIQYPFLALQTALSACKQIVYKPCL